MHEYSVATALLSQVERTLRQHPGSRVHIVDVCVGELSGVEPTLLVTAFDLAKRHTACADASLRLAREAALWVCPRCAVPVAPGALLQCADCAVAAQLIRGGALRLVSLDLESGDV